MRNILKTVAYTYREKIRKGNFYMEYAKDEVFQIRYNTKLNRLESKEENWTSRLVKKIKSHKLLTSSIIAFLLLATANVVMIGSFIKILQNV